MRQLGPALVCACAVVALAGLGVLAVRLLWLAAGWL